MDDLVKKLRSQIGDDVQEIYLHEALFSLAADRIEAQAAEIERLTAKNDALLRAASTSRLAFAGYVSAQTAINELDSALGDAQ